MITMTRPAYHGLVAPTAPRTIAAGGLTGDAGCVAPATSTRPAAGSKFASAAELAAQGARNCWDPRSWGQDAAILPMPVR